MTLVSSGEISLYHEEDDKSIVFEVYGNRTGGKSLRDCYDDADPQPTLANSPNVAMSDFYLHSQQTYGLIQAREAWTGGSVWIYNSLSQQFQITTSATPAEYWNGVNMSNVRFYDTDSQSSFDPDTVDVICQRRTKGGVKFTTYQTLTSYTSSTISVNMFSYDYRFIVEDTTF